MSITSARPAAGRAALALFDDAPVMTRLHVRVRWHTCPFSDVASHVPVRGAVLDIGCGHGLFAAYLALGAAERRVVGVDLDDRKLACADTIVAAVHERGGTVELAVEASGTVPAGPWDAITIVDVLYLLPADAQRDLLTRAALQLAPRGRLLVKEMASTPVWKARWNRAQEFLAVKIAGVTASESSAFTFVDPSEMAAWFEASGLDVERVAIDRGYVHPHVLLVGTKPLEPGPAPIVSMSW